MPHPEKIRIATRKSRLAMWQAEHVRHLLLRSHPGLQVELLPMSTSGDRSQGTPLWQIGGKGLFIKELEDALLDNRADLAVHSMKDMPGFLPDGLHISAVLKSEDPRDALISCRYANLAALPEGAKVGTTSLRRKSQLKHLRPDLKICDLRGNVDTRLKRLDEDEFDAVIMATAGLNRLGLSERISQRLGTDLCLPAISQGIIGIETAIDNDDVNRLVSVLDHASTHTRMLAEREIIRGLSGDCRTPLAGHAVLRHDALFLTGRVGTPDGKRMLQAENSGKLADAEKIGQELVHNMLEQGAGEVLQSCLKYQESD